MAENEEKKEAKKEGSKLILILVILQGLTLLALIGLGAFVFLNMKKIKNPVVVQPNMTMAKNANTPEEILKEEEKKEEKKKVEKGEKVTYELDPFIVNLMDENGRRYLRVKMDLVLSSKKAQEEIEKKKPEIRDAILMTLSGKRFMDIASLEGKMRLRDEIKENVDKLLMSGKVLDVYFTEFIVQ